MALSLQPYLIQKIDALTYAFITTKGIEYRCSFLSYAEYFPSHPVIAPFFFSFNLALGKKYSKLPAENDKRIAHTVITIVGNFLNSKTNAVVYVCDNSDGREAARARKFLSWHAYDSHISHQILKISGDIVTNGLTLYTALLVHKKNKLKKELVLAYLELIDTEEKQ